MMRCFLYQREIKFTSRAKEASLVSTNDDPNATTLLSFHAILATALAKGTPSYMGIQMPYLCTLLRVDSPMLASGMQTSQHPRQDQIYN